MNQIKKFFWKDCIHIEFSRNGENFVLESQEEPLPELKRSFELLRETFLRSRQEFDAEHRARYGIFGISFGLNKEGEEYYRIYGYYIFPHSGNKFDNANSMVMHHAFPGFWDETKDPCSFPYFVTNEDAGIIESLKTALWNFIDGKRSQGNLGLGEFDDLRKEETVSFGDEEYEQ